MSIYNKLFEIQQNLKAPKGQYNDFGKYKYRNCEDILEAVKPLLKNQKAIITLSDELVGVGQRYYIKATACLTDIETGEQIKNEAYAREEEKGKNGMDASQVTGASSSYARKYALNGLLCIDDTKDSDTTNKGTNKGDTANKGTNKGDTANKGTSKKYCCEKCGKELEGFVTKSGKKCSPEQEYHLKVEKFGQALCSECLEKREAEKNEQSNINGKAC